MQDRKETPDDFGNLQLFQGYKTLLVTLSQQESLNEEQIKMVKDIVVQLVYNRNLTNKKIVDPKIKLPKEILLTSLTLLLDVSDLIDKIKGKHGLALLDANIFNRDDSDESDASETDDLVSESDSDIEIIFAPSSPSRSPSVSPSRYRFINNSSLTNNHPRDQLTNNAELEEMVLRFESRSIKTRK